MMIPSLIRKSDLFQSKHHQETEIYRNLTKHDAVVCGGFVVVVVGGCLSLGDDDDDDFVIDVFIYLFTSIYFITYIFMMMSDLIDCLLSQTLYNNKRF